MKLLLLSSSFVTLLPVHFGPAPLAPVGTGEVRTCRLLPEAGPVVSTASLRPLRQWIRDLIRDARPGSATLDCLIRAAESSRAVIYIDEAEADRHSWGGRTIFTGASGGYTYLRIELHRLRPHDTAALLAHELQHTLEIVASGVTKSEEVEHLYQRIGVESHGSGERQFDTAAAIRAGRTTLAELRHRNVRASAVMAAE